MTQKIVVEKEASDDEKNRYRYAAELEAGNLLYFPEIPFDVSQEEIHSLKQQLELYEKKTTQFLAKLLAPYAEDWIPGKAQLVTAPKTAFSVEASPTLPVHGERILRFYTNLDAHHPYHWMTSYPFNDLAMMFGGKQIAFPRVLSSSILHRLARKTKKAMHRLGVNLSLQSPYDAFMFRMEHFLKKNEQFQASCPKERWIFPPFSCWAIYTDLVTHAALSCHNVIEQTFIVPQKALLFPEKSPLGILERMTRGTLVISEYARY